MSSTWYDVNKECSNRFKETIEQEIKITVEPRNSYGWQLNNEEDYTEEQLEDAATNLNLQLAHCLRKIPEYKTTVEDHIRAITAKRMETWVNKYEDMAYGDDPLYEVIATVIDSFYASLQLIDFHPLESMK